MRNDNIRPMYQEKLNKVATPLATEKTQLQPNLQLICLNHDAIKRCRIQLIIQIPFFCETMDKLVGPRPCNRKYSSLMVNDSLRLAQKLLHISVSPCKNFLGWPIQGCPPPLVPLDLPLPLYSLTR
jgi:hypothetical protein